MVRLNQAFRHTFGCALGAFFCPRRMARPAGKVSLLSPLWPAVLQGPSCLPVSGGQEVLAAQAAVKRRSARPKPWPKPPKMFSVISKPLCFSRLLPKLQGGWQRPPPTAFGSWRWAAETQGPQCPAKAKADPPGGGSPRRRTPVRARSPQNSKLSPLCMGSALASAWRAARFPVGAGLGLAFVPAGQELFVAVKPCPPFAPLTIV